MKWLIVVVLVVIACVLAIVGLLAAADPEGRGGKLMWRFWAAALTVIALAIALSIYL